MAGNETYSLRSGTRLNKKISCLAVCSVLTLLALTTGFDAKSVAQETQSRGPSTVAATDVDTSLISRPLISEPDKENYKKIFQLQKASKWAEADALIAKLQSRMLIGDVMAERYLNRHYETSASEMIDWLKKYSDYTQASEIMELASRKYPELFASLPRPEKLQKLQGYGDANSEEVRFENNPKAKKIWLHSIDLWRHGKKAEAAKSFAGLAANKDSLSPWQYSAANFWASRAYRASGDTVKADEYLKQAASNSYVFYGILARKQLHKSLELDTKPIEAASIELDKLLAKGKVQRIIALAQAGLNERAESQIRYLFPSASKQEKWGLLFLASRLDLASVQISMAKQLEGEGRRLDMLKYPIPGWEPEGGFRVDPALIYALMRQESGFHSAAISSGGAMGLMQLMPKTAKIMQKTTMPRSISDNISEPVLNITLGERYVEHLLGNNLVSGNLFYMLAAYNAGIGRLKEWQENIDYNDDPLLFVESIPYFETRYYVMQVMTNYWIYSELAGASSQSIYSVLQNSWPNYALNSTQK